MLMLAILTLVHAGRSLENADEAHFALQLVFELLLFYSGSEGSVVVSPCCSNDSVKLIWALFTSALSMQWHKRKQNSDFDPLRTTAQLPATDCKSLHPS